MFREFSKKLDTTVSYDEISYSRWDEFPLGRAKRAKTVFWNPTTSPNLLISGESGSGRTSLVRNLIFHCLQHADRLRIIGIDLRDLDFNPYQKYDPQVLGIATKLEEGVDICVFAHEKMMERYAMLEELGLNNYLDLPDAPPALVLFINDINSFLAKSGIKTEEGIENDALKNESAIILTELTRLGRAAGIYLVLENQSPEPNIIYGALTQNISTRIVTGRVDASHSQMALNNEEATRTATGIPGRSYIQDRGEGEQFQVAFSPLDWFEGWLEKYYYPTDASDEKEDPDAAVAAK